MLNSDDIKYMERCLELASLGLGKASPNPMVGSVIVHQGTIIGEGYHRQCGQAHAEVNAVNSVKNKDLLKESTIYVNLEPCAHFGKTPPCANLIVAEKIPRAVIGCIDPFARVSGKGIEILRNAGCLVKLDILGPESKELNKRFFTYHQKKRPYIILKWAQTMDGYIDIERNHKYQIEPYWITNHLSKMLVHKWRSEESAFMVGANTVKNDNPRLTVREWNGRNPIRIVADRDLSLSPTLHLFNDEARTIIFNKMKDERLENLIFIKIDFDDRMIEQMLNKLYEIEIQSLVVEGGRQMLEAFITKNLWDEARVFTGNRYFLKGIKAPGFDFIPVSETMVGDSHLKYYRNTMPA